MSSPPSVNPDEVVAELRRRVAEALGGLDWEPGFSELEDLADPDFARACRKDPECRRIWLEILETTDMMNEEMEENVALEIAEILMNYGIDLDCEWETCFFVFKSFVVNPRRVEKTLRLIQGVDLG